MEVLDFYSRPIHTGDQVVFLEHSRTSPTLKSGVVTKVNPASVEIESYRGYKTRKSGYKVVIMAKKDNCTCCGDCIYYIQTNEKYGCCNYPPDGLGLKDRLISDYCSRAVSKHGRGLATDVASGMGGGNPGLMEVQT